MYHRHLADCFPDENLPTMWCCPEVRCFYFEVLFTWSEVIPKEKWSKPKQDLAVVATCPSCGTNMLEYQQEDSEVKNGT